MLFLVNPKRCALYNINAGTAGECTKCRYAGDVRTSNKQTCEGKYI